MAREKEVSALNRGSDVPTLAAVAYFLQYLRDSAKLTGFSPPKDLHPRELIDELGIAGHEIVLHAPRNGFTDYQKDALQSYATSLTYWRKSLVELEWEQKSVRVSFRHHRETDEDEEPGKLTTREKLRGKSYVAIRRIAGLFVSQGFMVREPVPVSLVTMTDRYRGWALMLKYPNSKVNDAAGIILAYDKWVPRLADIVAREMLLRGETLREGDVTTIFFTANKRYVSSLYDSAGVLRLLVPRRNPGAELTTFSKMTYRACKTLGRQYKKHFEIAKRPMAAWGVVGHSIVLHYKRGAMGKIADDSYIWNVRLGAEKLMKKYRVQGLVKHQRESRTIIVTFYSGIADKWNSVSLTAMDGVAAVHAPDDRTPVER